MKDDCRCANSYYAKKPQLKLQSETTHQLTYVQHPIPKNTELPLPKYVPKHYDPEALQSSYKKTFTSHPQAPIADQIDTVAYHLSKKPKNVPFYSDTSYKQAFTPHQVKPERQPAYEYKPKNTKFQGESSYKAQFVPKTNPALQESQDLSSYQQYMARKAKVPFEGKTSYAETFKDHKVKPQRQPEYRYQPKGTRFEGSSSYKETFRQPPKESYGNGTEYCPVHPEKVTIK